MSRQEFIDKHKHELMGVVLDAAVTNRTGADLALFCRTIMHRIDTTLARMYDSLIPAAPIPVKPNGATAPTIPARKVNG